MPYVVMDLEFNNMQGLGSELNNYVDQEHGKLRHIYPNEIIQIGAVKLDDGFNEIDRINIFIKNVFFNDLNPFISEMTGVTKEDIESGISYTEAINTLKDFSIGSTIITWGISDIYEIMRNCHMHQMEMTVLGDNYIDLQEVVGLKEFDNKSPSLKNSMIKYGLLCDDEMLHDGLYDAMCTGEVLKKYCRKYGEIKEVIKSGFLFSQDSIYINNVRVKDIPDSEITLICPLCEGHIIYDISMNNDHGKIKSMYHCEECNASYIENISIKENMTGNRKYFKKIKKIPNEYYKMIVNQSQNNKNNKHY